MEKTTLQLEALASPSSIRKIDSGVSDLYGVHSVKVIFHSSKVKAKFDETLITSEDIADRIEQLGYPVVKVQME